MSEQLPERPNLEQLKKQAKSLLHTAQAGDATALRRFAALPAFSKEVAFRTKRVPSCPARCAVGYRTRARLCVVERVA